MRSVFLYQVPAVCRRSRFMGSRFISMRLHKLRSAVASWSETRTRQDDSLGGSIADQSTVYWLLCSSNGRRLCSRFRPNVMGGSPATTNWRGSGVGREPHTAKIASPAQTSDRAAQVRADRLRRQYHESKAPTMPTRTRISNSMPRTNSSILRSSRADGSIQIVLARSLPNRTTRSPILNVSTWHAPSVESDSVELSSLTFCLPTEAPLRDRLIRSPSRKSG